MSDLSEKFTLIPKGIDVDYGLSICAGKQDLYFKMLMLFVDKYHDFVPRFNEAFTISDPNAGMGLAHSLKGVAGCLGAMHLQEKAATLELACKNKAEEHNIMASLGSVESELMPLINGLVELKSME